MPPFPRAAFPRALQATIRQTTPRKTTMSTTAPKPNRQKQGPDWDALAYLRFATERTRPAHDLLAAIPTTARTPTHIIDLGCGPANSTALLSARYPSAKTLTGIDSSPAMLRAAREALPSATFEQGDLRTYTPASANVDVLFSNAALHWLPPAELLPSLQRFVGALRRGTGVFAMQVPDNVAEPSHVLMAETAREAGAPWAGVLAERGVQGGRERFPEAGTLYNALRPLCGSVDIWRTEYFHRLGGHEAVVAWFRESALRPFLEPLDEAQKVGFEERYLERVKEAYPLMEDGSVLLRFPRLFVVCVRE